jgi:hypothetical protein
MSNKNRKILIVLINNNFVVVVVDVSDFVAQDHNEEISNKNVQIINKN